MSDTDRRCRTCQAPLVRKRFPCGRLESKRDHRGRYHCDQHCYMTAPIKRGVQRQTILRHAAAVMPREKCTRCGTKKELRAVFKNGDQYDFAPSNLDVLCRVCLRDAQQGSRPKPSSPV